MNTLKSKCSFLESMIPSRIFNMHGIIQFHRRFYRIFKCASQTELLTERFFEEPKMVLLWKPSFGIFIFYTNTKICVKRTHKHRQRNESKRHIPHITISFILSSPQSHFPQVASLNFRVSHPHADPINLFSVVVLHEGSWMKLRCFNISTFFSRSKEGEPPGEEFWVSCTPRAASQKENKYACFNSLHFIYPKREECFMIELACLNGGLTKLSCTPMNRMMI